MDDQQLLRYNRQIMLPEFDVAGQERLANARVLVVGTGGLGSPAAIYLVTAGVGHLTIVDDDEVELTNLQRQILHTEKDLGKEKVESAIETLRGFNPDGEIIGIAQRLEGDLLESEVARADMVLDCSDNFITRFALNKSCFTHRKVLISGAAIRFEGQLVIFDFRYGDGPCYNCIFADVQQSDLGTCSENGVISPLVGVIGSLQALEAIKVVAQCGEPSTGKLQLFEGLTGQWREMRLLQDPECPVCSMTGQVGKP